MSELNSLLDSYFVKENEFKREFSTPPVNYAKLSQNIISCVRLLCERMGFVETFSVSEAVYNLRRACKGTHTPIEFSAAIALEVN